MEKTHDECDEGLIDRYFDGELGQEEYGRLNRHLRDCRSCQKILRDNQAISNLFRDSLKREISRIGFDDLEERVLDLARQKELPWWRKFTEQFVSMKLLIPATATAVLLLFFFIAREPATVSELSAIVESFSGEVSSVMIIEAPRSRQTIIWYQESS